MTVKCTLRNPQPSSRTYKSSNCSFVNFFQYSFLTFPFGEPQAFFLKKYRGGEINQRQHRRAVRTESSLLFLLLRTCRVFILPQCCCSPFLPPPRSLPCPHSNHFLTSHCVKFLPSPLRPPPHNTPYLQSTSLVCVSCRIPPYPNDHFTPVPTAARSNSAEPAARHSTRKRLPPPSLPGVD